MPPDATLRPEDLETVLDEFTNHGDIDEDSAAIEIIDEYISRGWLRQFSSHDDLARYVGGKPILNMFACLKKDKLDPATGQWVVKRRLIMDSKRSNVKEASNKE